ncbi:MAG: hypothetical protein IJ017_02865 [Oscillospiraceae bacterium]|nr:hypothetical protein [Oscillospiraceae bacterium]
MRRLLAFLLVLVIVFSFVGCKKNSDEETPAEDTTVQDTQQDPPEQNEENTPVTDETPADTSEDEQETKPEANEDTQVEQEQEQETEQEAALPYTEKIVRADQSVFDSPSYDANYVGVVEEAGIYTIVEEATDDEGNLWGKLKSGLGWVDLTDIRSFNWPVSANFADEKLLESGNYHYYEAENQDYTVQVAIRAYEELSYVTIYPMELTDDGFIAGDAVFYIEKLTPDKPLVADLSFPGDMSQYAIEFTTEQGAETYFRVYISGRNGTLVMDE